MTAIGDFCNTIRGWLAFEYTDALILSWTRMAEEYLSESLRCKHMIAIDRGLVSEQRVKLPADWLELDVVREVQFVQPSVVPGDPDIVTGVNRPLLFKSRDDFYGNTNDANDGFYTITGNYLIVGGNPGSNTPVNIEISYFQTIPPLGDDPNWLYSHYLRLYVTATLTIATSYSIEDERGAAWQAASQDFIDRINTNHTLSKASGSKLKLARRTKGFG